MVAEISQGAEMTAGVCQQAAVSAEREKERARAREGEKAYTVSLTATTPTSHESSPPRKRGRTSTPSPALICIFARGERLAQEPGGERARRRTPRRDHPAPRRLCALPVLSVSLSSKPFVSSPSLLL
ncbi:hypothetical protein F2P79_017781 [Pimephales promelas]|nr:hypothetical protein F2P79_017781 [Pimephales promelas]